MQQIYACPNCKAQVVYGQSVCSKCGVTLDWGVQQAPPPLHNQQDTDPQQTWGQQMYACPNCQAQVAYGQSVCGNCSITLNWGGIPQAPDWVNPNQYQQQNMYSKIMAMLKKKYSSGIITYLIVLLVVLIAAGGIVFALNGNLFAPSPGNSPNDLTPTSPTSPPKIPPEVKSFSADPSTITQGQETTLSWNVSRATSVSIDQDIGTVSSSGTQVISPAITTTYHLTATNNAGPVSDSVVVTVNEPPEPGITSFSASPSSITSGESVTLQWKVARANSVIIDQGIGIVSSSGKKEVTPNETTTYTLTASNGIGSVTKSVTITVAAAGAPVITSFTADPVTIGASQNSTLSWDVSGATSVSINQGIGNVLASGTKIVSPTTTTTYTLTARNNAGSVTAPATITVASNLPVITFFTATPGTIGASQNSTLQWNVTGATSVSISPTPGTVSPTTGTQVVSPATTTIYTLTATNSYGSVTKSATVTVTSTSPPVITSFTATPYSNGYSTLQWSITGADSVSIDQGIGAQSSFYVDVYPTVPTTYTLTAINSYGTDTKTVTVTVP